MIPIRMLPPSPPRHLPNPHILKPQPQAKSRRDPARTPVDVLEPKLPQALLPQLKQVGQSQLAVCPRLGAQPPEVHVQHPSKGRSPSQRVWVRGVDGKGCSGTAVVFVAGTCQPICRPAKGRTCRFRSRCPRSPPHHPPEVLPSLAAAFSTTVGMPCIRTSIQYDISSGSLLMSVVLGSYCSGEGQRRTWLHERKSVKGKGIPHLGFTSSCSGCWARSGEVLTSSELHAG